MPVVVHDDELVQGEPAHPVSARGRLMPTAAKTVERLRDHNLISWPHGGGALAAGIVGMGAATSIGGAIVVSKEGDRGVARADHPGQLEHGAVAQILPAAGEGTIATEALRIAKQQPLLCSPLHRQQQGQANLEQAAHQGWSPLACRAGMGALNTLPQTSASCCQSMASAGEQTLRFRCIALWPVVHYGDSPWPPWRGARPW